MQSERRRRKLIKPALQLRSVVAFAAMAGILVLVQGMNLMYSLENLFDGSPKSQGEVARALPSLVTSNILVTLVMLVPFLFAVGIIVSARMAGPIFRFEGYLRAVIDGRETGPCKIRDRDELQELCDLINAASEPMRASNRSTATQVVAVDPDGLVRETEDSELEHA